MLQDLDITFEPDTDALVLERSMYPVTEEDEVTNMIEEDEAVHDRYSNDCEREG